MKLQGKIVVITGGSRGLGRAICLDLQRYGATVVSCSAHRSPVTDYVVDVRKPAAVKKFIASVKKKYGRIDVLINNAGWIEKNSSLEKLLPSEFSRTMETNVSGVFHVLREVLPIMKKQKEGTVVNIGSRAARKSRANLAAYCASKAAVISLTQSVAKGLLEVDSTIRCFSFSPGGIDTDMRAKVFGKAESKSQRSAAAVATLLTFCLQKSVPLGADIQVENDGTLKTIAMN